MLYIIHFDVPLHHAQHYVGYCKDGRLMERLLEHHAGNGSKLLRAVSRAGIGWKVAKELPGDRTAERKLKNRKNTKQLCPICNHGRLTKGTAKNP